MKALRPHVPWLAAFCAACVLLTATDPLSEKARAIFSDKIRQAENMKSEAERSLQFLRADANTARALSREVTAGEVEAFLAPTDRLQIAARLEQLAAGHRLSRLVYAFSPEKSFVPPPSAPDAEGLSESVLTLEADAPHDVEVFRFLEEARKLLPGRACMKNLTIELLPRLAAANVHFSASIDWLSNGSGERGNR